jgi:hypothetical protein
MKLSRVILFIIGAGLMNSIAIAELSTEKAVLNNDDKIIANAQFSVAKEGDLYVATKINDQLIFFANGGKNLTITATPFLRNGKFSGKVPLFNLSAKGVPAGRYPLYQVVVETNKNPFETRNWRGKLNIINFMINLATTESGDLDDDGFADNDSDHDGFYDDDKNQDGFYDDDRDKDGYRDGDLNRNGITDDKTSPPKDKEDKEDKEEDKPVSTDPTILQGKSFYNTCAASACHGADPKANQHDVLKGKDHNLILNAIANDTGGMGILKNTLTAESAKQISAYLNSL